MLKPMINCRATTNEELRETAERYMTSIKKLYEKAAEGSLRLEVEALLKDKPDGWEEQLASRMQSEEYADLMKVDGELLILKKLYEETALLRNITSLSELQEVYQKTVFLLRRLELDVMGEDCEELWDLMEQWDLTVQYFLKVITGGKIYRYWDTAYMLSSLFAANGYGEYAEEIALWLKKRSL